jgi:uncharacterized protein (DUF1697 family)
MTSYIALLRGVNVGGVQLAMADLKAVAVSLGYEKVSTYIASGNLLFESGEPEPKVKPALEAALTKHMGRTLTVMVRSAAEMAKVLADNPFPDKDSKYTVAIFLDGAPDKDALVGMTAPDGEEARLGVREIYVHYPAGQGRSKMKLPAARAGTARNINTVAKLAELAGGRPGREP